MSKSYKERKYQQKTVEFVIEGKNCSYTGDVEFCVSMGDDNQIVVDIEKFRVYRIDTNDDTHFRYVTPEGEKCSRPRTCKKREAWFELADQIAETKVNLPWLLLHGRC